MIGTLVVAGIAIIIICIEHIYWMEITQYVKKEQEEMSEHTIEDYIN